MRTKKIKIICTYIVVLVLLTGCGRNFEEVPELISPVALNDSFRRVDIGCVYDVKTLLSYVVPKEYGAFFDESTKVDFIYVDLGDYVNEGDVLAKMNTKELEQELALLDRQIEGFKQKHYYEELIAEEMINEQAISYPDDTASYGDASFDREKEIEVIRENNRYDNMLYEKNLKVLEDRRNSIALSIESSTIRAGHAGYVTYIKKLSDSNLAEAFENIVIVSDFDELSLEISEDMSNIKEYEEAIDKTYVMLGDKKINLSIKPYSHEECAAMDKAGNYLRIRYTFPDIKKVLYMGDVLPIYIEKSDNGDVLRIGRDSLYTDGDVKYVYVKTESGKERREIVTGREGSFYVEVKDGLSADEWIYYTSKTIAPSNYEEYVVSSDVFLDGKKKDTCNGLKRYTISYPYFFDFDIEAYVSEIMVKKNDFVKKGDLVCKLNTKYGYAKRIEADNKLKNVKDERKRGINAYREQIKAIDKNIKKCEKEGNTLDAGKLKTEKTITEYNMEIAKISYDEDIYVACFEYDKACAENDGSGFIYIYAEHDGYIGELTLYEGKKLGKDSFLFSIYDKDSLKLAFDMENGYLGIGSEVIINCDGKSYKSKIVGNQGIQDKFYVGKKDGKTYITKTDATGLLYTDIDDSFDLDCAENIDVECYKSLLKDTIAIPRELLHTEIVYFNTKYEYKYVYKLDCDNLVKQWVYTWDETDSNNMVYILDGLKEGDIIVYDRKDKK